MPIKIIIVSLFAVSLFFGCTSLSKNFVQPGKLFLNGGIYHDKTWHEKLVFEKYSWLHEMMLMFDLNIARVDPKSPFFQWFSDHEREQIANCADFFVVLSYTNDGKRISHRDLLNEMSRNGMEPILIPEFNRNLKLHPDYDKNTLAMYRVEGFCRATPVDSKILTIKFPGYLTERIDY